MNLRFPAAVAAAVVVMACADPSGLEYSAGADDSSGRPALGSSLGLTVDVALSRSESGRWLLADIAVTNRGEKRLERKIGGDPFTFRAYGTPERAGTPLWRSGDGIQVYPAALWDFNLDPAETREFHSVVGEISAIVQDRSRPSYFLTVAIRFREPAERTGELPAGEIELP